MLTFDRQKRRRRRLSKAERARRCEISRASYQRKRAGLVMITLELDETDLRESLVDAGRLGQWVDADREMLRAALEVAIRELIRADGMGFPKVSPPKF